MMQKVFTGGQRTELAAAAAKAGLPAAMIDQVLGGLGLQANDAATVISRSLGSLLRFENRPDPVGVIAMPRPNLACALTGMGQLGELPRDPQTQKLLAPLAELEVSGRQNLAKIAPDPDLQKKIGSMWELDRQIMQAWEKDKDSKHVIEGNQYIASYHTGLEQARLNDSHFLSQGGRITEQYRTANRDSFVSVRDGVIARVYTHEDASMMFESSGNDAGEQRAVVLFNTRKGGTISINFRQQWQFNALIALTRLLDSDAGIRGDAMYAESGPGRDLNDFWKTHNGFCQIVANPGPFQS